MPSENARRDSLLADIARELREINKNLKRLADQRKTLKFANSVGDMPDPFDPDLTAPPAEPPAEPEKYVHPYLRRSEVDAAREIEGTNAVE